MKRRSRVADGTSRPILTKLCSEGLGIENKSCAMKLLLNLEYRILYHSEMRRGSTSKSSMFKIQSEKSQYQNYLKNIQSCKTVRLHPQLLESIKKSSNTIFDLCYNSIENSAFVKGINYECRQIGFSMPHSTTLVYRDWFPAAKEVSLVMISESHEMKFDLERLTDEVNMWEKQIQIQSNQVSQNTKMFVRIMTQSGETQEMPPPSCKIQDGKYGYILMNPDIPIPKHQKKKQQIIEAYTLDVEKISLDQVISFLGENYELLQKFNTVIIRNLFTSEYLLDRHTLTLQQMEVFRDIISKCKNELGLKVILQWGYEPGKNKYENNLVEKNLFVEEEPGVWQYDLSKKEVIIIYLSNLSYYLTFLKLDGFHFKRIQAFSKSEDGQVLIKCMNLMNSKIKDTGFTLASSKNDIPGLNQPILQGGLGFTFSYSWDENFMESNSHIDLKTKFDKILGSSNCIPFDLNFLTPEKEMNFLFAVFASGKGVFCKGSLRKNQQLIEKVLRTRNQSQIFGSQVEFQSVDESSIVFKRDRAWILFNFSPKTVTIELEGANQMQVINVFGCKQPLLLATGVQMLPRSCLILEE